ncbi:hypothetical protein RDI58_030048 [Solanum bulbocastanum]|uniref:Uncharacterized protein n=1 Tax=Solanum bulbocastanum TaxID=147425 RepID=A0AAN8SRN1_SOLBU
MEKERMHLQPLSHIHLPRHDIDSRQSALLQPVTAIDWGESASLTAGTVDNMTFMPGGNSDLMFFRCPAYPPVVWL